MLQRSSSQSPLPRRTNAKTHRYLHNKPALERTSEPAVIEQVVKRFRKRVVRKNALDNIGVAARTISRDNREPVRAEWSRVQEKKVS